jgi:hypothetical protein
MERHIQSNNSITILKVISSVLKLEAALFSETPILTYKSKRCQTSEQNNPCNLKPYFISNVQQTFTVCVKRSVILILIIKRDALFLKFILIKNYMFRTDLLSIIRSLNTVYIAIGVCYASYVDCLGQ